MQIFENPPDEPLKLRQNMDIRQSFMHAHSIYARILYQESINKYSCV